MLKINEAAHEYFRAAQLGFENPGSEAGFKAGVEFAQRWISVEDELPICYESGDWDGLRSDFVLVKNKNGAWRKGRLYSGIIDGSKYSDWYDEYDFELDNITHWRPIEIK